MKKKKFRNSLRGWAAFSLFLLLNSFALFAQNVTVRGTVADASADPIIGATIVVKGNAAKGTATDVDGKYTLANVLPDAILEVSYVGMKSQEIAVNGRTTINIVMKDDSELLDEVVVVGYGTMKKKDLTGAVANIKAKDMNTQSNANIAQALQGKIAGIDIVSQGGAPGGNTRIMVRGIGTLNNSSPLYIVDGMYMNSIDHINPSDVASIDVLKDASSAAIYGSRAANGVIIITTKEGSDTEGKPIINVSSNFGVASSVKFLDMLNAKGWAEVTTVARKATNLPVLEMASDLKNKPDNDWQNIMLRSALIQNHTLSVKGGGKYTTFYNSVSYFDQDGTVKGTNYKRYTLQSKTDFKKGIFSAGTNVVFTYDDNIPLMDDSRGGMLGAILQNVPTLKKYDENRVGGYGGSYGDVVNLPHPLAMVDKNIMERTTNNAKIYMNGFVQLELLKGLKYKLNLSPDFSFHRYSNYNNKYDFGLNTNNRTWLDDRQSRRKNVLIEHLVNFDQTFGSHKISALLGYSYHDRQYRFISAHGEKMPDGVREITAATDQRTNDGYSSRNVLTSLLGRIFYSYKNRYLVTATMRRDGSSKFAKGNRYGNFPSFSLGWNMAEEGFMKNMLWLNQFKLRGGYGVLGNSEIEDYQYSSTITTGINYPDGKGGLLQGAFPKDFSNPDIRWEETAMTNIGLDFMALNNRLSITLDGYVKNTKDILLTVPIPISTGGANDPVKNAGKIRNKGIEISVGWRDYLSKELSYNINFAGSYNKNEVVQLGTGTQAIYSGMTNQGVAVCKTLAGYPIGGYWLIPTDGYFHSEQEVQSYAKNKNLIQPVAKPGDVRFKDVNDDGIINDEDRVYQGSPFPDFTFSINSGITYKDIDFSIGLQSVLGNKIYNATRQTLEDVTKGANFLASTLDYWTPERKDASHPRLVWDDPNRNTRAESARYLENGSYFRIRNVQVGYTLPKAWLRDLANKARVYINAENLLTFTNYKGYSPDVDSWDVNSRGFDNFTYPINRIFMVGANVTF